IVQKSKYLNMSELLNLLKQVNELVKQYPTDDLEKANSEEFAKQLQQYPYRAYDLEMEKEDMQFEIEVAMCTIEPDNDHSKQTIEKLQRMHTKLTSLPALFDMAKMFAQNYDVEALE